ncbi:MAG: DNA ligase D [Gemmatimonadaceae bacterium]|nr:DNA ligase D [Gemmatimonadaceae bacterium]
MNAAADSTQPPENDPDQAPPSDSLAAYRAKRSSDTSPEPVGRVAAVSTQLFVVHKHAARQLHYDLRLEMDGVLRSWAVPKGPSYDQDDKRFAAMVEDHPIEYGDFEGVIPAGNYGAGGMIVWDRGEWVALNDWREGLVKGKLLFELRGYKLHGKWTLVKIKSGERDWLLIKERDSFLKKPGDQFPQQSVLSGLTVEDVAQGRTRDDALRAAVVATGAPRARVDVRTVEAMLAEPSATPFTRDGWLFELKLDGYRLIAAKSGGNALLLSRNGKDYTTVFPEVARAIKALPFAECIVDGEVVVMDDQGKPNFSLLQKRGQLSSLLEIPRAAVERPATMFLFDLLAFDDYDLRTLTLRERKALLMEYFPSLGPVRTLDHIEREGERFLEQVAAMQLEGIIAKRADSRYRGGRSDSWLKLKTDRSADFVIVGFTAPKGGRPYFGALQIADLVRGELVYAGRVGTGFSDALLAELHAMLAPFARATAPCAGPASVPGVAPLGTEHIPDPATTTWVEPRVVCEVRFREWTPDGVLRHPTFLRIRHDKAVHECERQHWIAEPDVAMPEPTEAPAVAERPHVTPPTAPEAKVVTLTNLKKVYWPEQGYTKGDMVEYYRTIAPFMLPYLRGRPAVLTRFPDGIDGKSFYQKDVPDGAPSWLRTVPIWSEDTQREIQYIVCDDVETLLYIANSGSIPIHMWASRVDTLEQPDWCVVDLDPKDAPFSDVIRTALALHALCESIGLPNFVKTTGKTGLHILLPLPPQSTYAQSRTLGELLARLVLRELDDIATITRHVTKRGAKVYFDYLQNRHGQTIVAPFSVRPLTGATVSMPLEWHEVNASLDPREFTIRNAHDRMERLGYDPVAAVFNPGPTLQAVLLQLAARM